MRGVTSPQVRRRRRIAITATVLAVGVLALAVLGFAVWWNEGSGVDHAKRAADHYLARLEAKDDAAAYATLCDSVRRDLTPDRFTDLVEAAPRPASHIVADGYFTDEAGRHATVSTYLIDSDSTHHGLMLTLTLDDDSWSVCGTTLI